MKRACGCARGAYAAELRSVCGARSGRAYWFNASLTLKLLLQRAHSGEQLGTQHHNRARFIKQQ
eukprot:scaffold81730_cov54-Phaeocystis_antarctica.AAC.2